MKREHDDDDDDDKDDDEEQPDDSQQPAIVRDRSKANRWNAWMRAGQLPEWLVQEHETKLSLL